MANPFEVTPANPLQALMMGVQGYNTGKQAMQDNALSEAGRLYAAGDVKGAQAAAARGGSLQALMGLGQQANNERDFAFRQTEAQRAQQNADRGFGLQERQIGATAGNTAAQLALQRAQFAFQQEQGNRPELREVTDANGNKNLVLVDRKDPTKVQPVNVPGQNAVPSNIPPGVDPTTYRREMAQAAAKDQTTTRDLQEGGKGVIAMVEQLEKKIVNPTDPTVAKKFGAATGPFVGPASEAGAYDPRKLAYEGLQSREAKAYLDQIKQDATAINSVMERNLLKGGGSITDGERATIRTILGRISEARSPEDAQALLNNFKGIVRQMFKMEGGQPQAAGGQAQGAGSIPPPPSGFVVQ
jgi:hypothetical protein